VQKLARISTISKYTVSCGYELYANFHSFRIFAPLQNEQRFPETGSS